MANELIICHPVGPNITISSPFGPRNGKLHYGVDFPGKLPIYAVEDSIVVTFLLQLPNAPSIYIQDSNGVNIKDSNNKEIINPATTKAINPNITLKGKFTGNHYTYLHQETDNNLINEYNEAKKSGKNLEVKAGRQLGIMGNYGNSRGFHLHFEMPGSISPPTNAKTVTKNGTKFTDPESWLKENVNFYSKENTFVQPVKNTGSVAKANSNAGKRFTLGEGDFTSLVNIDFVKLVNKV